MPATDIRFRMTPGAEDLLPAKAHPDDAAFDLRAADDLSQTDRGDGGFGSTGTR